MSIMRSIAFEIDDDQTQRRGYSAVINAGAMSCTMQSRLPMANCIRSELAYRLNRVNLGEAPARMNCKITFQHVRQVSGLYVFEVRLVLVLGGELACI